MSLSCARSTNPQRGVVEGQFLHEVQTDADGRFRLEAITGTVYGSRRVRATEHTVTSCLHPGCA